MKYKKRKSYSTTLNMTPLIDIVFLLLIFFMLTAHFVEEKAMDIELPNSENAVKVDNDERITIAIDKASTIYFCGKKTEKEHLLEQLKARFATDTKREIYIQGDKSTHLELLLEIMDIGKKADAKAISIETRDDG